MRTFENLMIVADGDYDKLIGILNIVGEVTKTPMDPTIDKLDKLYKDNIVGKFRNEHSNEHHTPLYFVEVGVLLDKEYEEYDYYAVDLCGKTLSLYDENRLAFFDLEEAKKYASLYLLGGVVNTYAIIYYTKVNLDSMTDTAIFEVLNDCCFNDMLNPNDDNTLIIQSKDEDGTIDGWYYDDTKIKS